MDLLTRLYVKVHQAQYGQTMTEYVLILAAIAVAGYVAYVALAGAIASKVGSVTSQLG